MKPRASDVRNAASAGRCRDKSGHLTLMTIFPPLPAIAVFYLAADGGEQFVLATGVATRREGSWLAVLPLQYYCMEQTAAWHRLHRHLVSESPIDGAAQWASHCSRQQHGTILVKVKHRPITAPPMNTLPASFAKSEEDLPTGKLTFYDFAFLPAFSGVSGKPRRPLRHRPKRGAWPGSGLAWPGRSSLLCGALPWRRRRRWHLRAW